MSYSSIIDLLKKLKALADRGVGGEKENAQQMLQRLMDKHGISLEDIEGEVKRRRDFFISDEQMKFFKQVVGSVVGREYVYKSRRGDRRKKKLIALDLTDADYIEIDAKFDFFWKAWEKDVLLFYKAFVQKNHLYSKPNDDEKEEDDDREYTAEEKAEFFRMAQMMAGMEKHNFQKQLKQ